jgi:hypothetical protein
MNNDRKAEFFWRDALEHPRDVPLWQRKAPVRNHLPKSRLSILWAILRRCLRGK